MAATRGILHTQDSEQIPLERSGQNNDSSGALERSGQNNDSSGDPKQDIYGKKTNFKVSFRPRE